MIIADFKREYQIDLFEDAHTMPTDRFIIYLSGLSTQSVFIATLAKQHKDSRSKGTDINTLSPKDLATLMGAKKRQV